MNLEAPHARPPLTGTAPSSRFSSDDSGTGPHTPFPTIGSEPLLLSLERSFSLHGQVLLIP
jgi:hypothetical protein